MERMTHSSQAGIASIRGDIGPVAWETEICVMVKGDNEWVETSWGSIDEARRIFPDKEYRTCTRKVTPWVVSS